MVRHRPPHPLAPTRLRLVRKQGPRGRKGKKPNPKANLEVLSQTRFEGDDTRGLRPKPGEHPGWANRFNKEEMERERRVPVEPEPAPEMPKEVSTEEEEMPPAADSGPKRRNNYKPDQIKLF
jgi:hypothetical protein